jgi:hypothetical protein
VLIPLAVHQLLRKPLKTATDSTECTDSQGRLVPNSGLRCRQESYPKAAISTGQPEP